MLIKDALHNDKSLKISAVSAKRNVRIRSVALPVEHGAWGFLFEPLVAAVAVAPSFAAVWVSLLYIGAFLLRQPIKVLLSGWKSKQTFPHTAVALKFVLLYGAIFCIGLSGSLIYASIENFIPLAFVIPFAIYQIYCDVSRQSRKLLPELTGGAAISSSAAVIALAGGWSLAAAIALWAIFVARLLPSILYVRNRLLLEKGKHYSMIPAVSAHFAAFGVIGMLAAYGLASMLTVLVFIVLLGRAFFGFSPYRQRMKAMKIGVWEVFYGVLTVLSVIIGYYSQI